MLNTLKDNIEDVKHKIVGKRNEIVAATTLLKEHK